MRCSALAGSTCRHCRALEGARPVTYRRRRVARDCSAHPSSRSLRWSRSCCCPRARRRCAATIRNSSARRSCHSSGSAPTRRRWKPAGRRGKYGCVFSHGMWFSFVVVPTGVNAEEERTFRARMVRACRSSRGHVGHGRAPSAVQEVLWRDRTPDPQKDRRCRRSVGAGEGNRTLVCSLGSCRSTIELRPHSGCSRTGRRTQYQNCSVQATAKTAPARSRSGCERLLNPPPTWVAECAIPGGTRSGWAEIRRSPVPASARPRGHRWSGATAWFAGTA